MDDQHQPEDYRNNRRLFLKSMGIAMGATTLESATAVAQEPGDESLGQPNEWTTARSNPRRTGAINENGPAPSATTDWKMDLDGGLLSREPIVANETVYLAVTTDNDSSETKGTVGAYDIETGNQKWEQPDLPSPKTPTVDDQLLYVATSVAESSGHENGGLYALDVENGDIVWSRTDLLRWTSPIVTDNQIYTSNENGAYALDRTTGNTVWKTGGIGKQADGSDGALSYANGTIFFSDGTALNAADGSVKWRVTDGSSTFGNHIVDGDRVYYLKADYFEEDDDTITVEARSPNDGTVLWKHEIYYKTTLDRRFAVANGYVLFYDLDDGNAVTALDAATGTRRWTKELNGDAFSNLTVANDTIYLGGRHINPSDPKGRQAVIYALDLSTGDQKWAYFLDSSDLETSSETPPAAGTPVVTDGRLYLSTYPAGSMFGYQYIQYSNFFALKSSST